jgi:ATP-dependent Clp protease ATP-binding subunit ClpC
MFNRFTERARKILILAKEEARRLNHDYIGTEHLLLALVSEQEGVAAAVLQNLGIDLALVKKETTKLIQPGGQTQIIGELPFTPRAKKVLELSAEEARSMGHNYIGTEHLLLGLLREGEGIASQVLFNIGLDINTARKATAELLGGTFSSESGSTTGSSLSQPANKKTPALNSFGRDLTSLAQKNLLDPVIGREKEIERVIQVLSRRTKNNPVLLGEAGVGKTAIVEGLAQSIVTGDVPEILRNKRIVVLDLAQMVAGTKYRGQFEERIKAIIEEIKRSKDVVIFIDEIHTLVGAGAAEGAIDASNILKPALSRGEIQCIGATTLDEYRKYVEKDAALERRFQSIFVDPPSVLQTIEILKGLRDRYEAHHRVKFTDEAVEAAANLSERYISGRFLPDKAVDLIDEAGSRARLGILTRPPAIQEIEKKLQEIIREKEALIKQQDFEEAAKLRDQEREYKLQLEQKRKDWVKGRDKILPHVSAEDIAKLISQWTGIPLFRLEQEESEKLLKMEDELAKRVIGQKQAITAIAKSLRRARAGIKDPKRPIGSFIFMGPTGVGKTLLARALSDFMFGDDEALIQLDMSEYMEKFNVSRLIGAPPGYVGYEEGGQLSERVRRRPYSVILLDELEKAHPEVFNILLQILEEGHLTDSFGRRVDFRNTILIMTSNVGVGILKSKGSLGFTAVKEEMNYDEMKARLDEEVKKTFKPEFLNRLDEIIVFRPLDKQSLEQIIDIEIGYVNQRLKEQNLKVTLTKQAKELFSEKGFDPVFGARPLKRIIQKYLEDPLAEEIISGRFKDKKKKKPDTIAEIKIVKGKGETLSFE